MKKMTYFILLLGFLVACQPQPEYKSQLVGAWKGISWAVAGEESGRDAGSVSFVFGTDDTYSARYGSQKETGTYRLKADKLYTTADDEKKIEKMVQFSFRGKDTLLVQMNRMGSPEQLTLLRAAE